VKKAAGSRTSSLPDPSFQWFSALTVGAVFEKKLITGRLKRIIAPGVPPNAVSLSRNSRSERGDENRFVSVSGPIKKKR
jgi:hypothetical protein